MRICHHGLLLHDLWPLGHWGEVSMHFQMTPHTFVQPGAQNGPCAITPLPSLITFKDAETLLHAFVSSHLDCCNSLFTCLNQKSTELLSDQAFNKIQETWSHHSYFSLCFRIHFKILPISFRASRGLSASFIWSFSTLITNSYFETPRHRNCTKSDRTIAVRAPRLWDGLTWGDPSDSVDSFLGHGFIWAHFLLISWNYIFLLTIKKKM